MAAPAYFPVVGDVFRLSAGVINDKDHTAYPSQWYRVSGVGASPDSLLTVTANWLTAITPALKDLAYNACFVQTAKGKKMWPVPQSFTYVVGQTPVSGTAGAVPLPDQTSYLVSKQSVVASRRGRGRFYAPYPSESQLGTDGALTAGAVTLLTALATFLENPFTSGSGAGIVNLVPVIANVKLKPTPTLDMFDQVACTASAFFATQRRRGHFRAAHR